MAPASAVPLSTMFFALVTPSPTGPLSGLNLGAAVAIGATVSTVTARTAEGAPVFPAPSVTVVVKLCAPSARLLAVTLQAPVASAVAVPTALVPSSTVTVAPASAVPLSVTALVLVMLPTVVPSARFTAETAEATGATVSTVTARAADATLSFPAASVTVVVKLCAPSARLLAVALQAPLASAVVVATTAPPSDTFTTAPGSAVPRKTTVFVLVAVATLAPSSARFTSATGETAGAVASTVTSRAADTALSLPASSTTVVVKLCAPSPRLLAVTLQAPVASAVVEATSAPRS